MPQGSEPTASSIPALSELFEAVGGVRDPDAFLTELHEPFERFVAQAPPAQVIARKLARMIDRPGDTLDMESGAAWCIASTAEAALYLSLPTAQDEPEDAPMHRLWAAVAGGPLRTDRYIATDAAQSPTGEPGPLREHTELVLAPGETVALQAGRDVLRIRQGPPTLTYELVSAPVRGQRWIYDPVTLAPHWAITASRTISQILYAVDLLGDLGTQAATAQIEAMALEHPLHFVRWHALESLAALAPVRAETALERLLDDPHPEVRQAAAAAAAELADPEGHDRRARR